MQDLHDNFIARFHQGDNTLIGDLYDTYGAALYTVILRIVRSRCLAEQVLQDTFVKAWHYRLRYDHEKGRVFTWLLNIARNAAIDATRTAHFKYFSQTENVYELVDQPSEDVINTDHLDLRKMANQLEEKYRTLVDLVYFQGYTQQEVADSAGIPIGTVKTRLRYAILELRKTFSEGATQSTTLEKVAA